MSIFYRYGNDLYINVTNCCHSRCIFCVRSRIDALGDSDTLWLDHEPSVEEIIAAYEALPNKHSQEIVFCGYGEPTERLEVVLEICRYLRKVSKAKIRINTNGLSDLINGKPTACMLEGLVDAVSISLNAPDAQEFLRITRTSFGEPAFTALLKFAEDCKKYVPQVRFTVVDILTDKQLADCQRIAQRMSIPLRVRGYGG